MPIGSVSELSEDQYSEWGTAIDHVNIMIQGRETYSQYSQRMLDLGVPVWAIKEGLRFTKRCERGEYGSG